MNTFAPPRQLPALVLPPYGPNDVAGMEPAPFPAAPRLGNILRRRWVSVALWVLAFTVGAGMLALRLPQVYTAKAQVVIASPASSARPGTPDRVDEIATTIETEVSTLGSRDLLGRVLDRLVTLPGFPVAAYSHQGRAQQAARAAAAWLLKGDLGAWIAHNAGPGQVAELRALAAPPDPAHQREVILDQLERNLRVGSEPRSRVISVRYTAADADVAALVVNTVTAAYIAAQEDRKRDGLERDLAWLDNHLPQQRADMEAAAAALSAFRMDNAVQDPADVEGRDQQVIALKRKLKAGSEGLAALNAERAAMGRLRANAMPDPVVTRFSPLLTSLQQQEQAVAQGGAAPGREAAALRAAIVAEADAATLRLDDEVTMLAARQAALNREVAAMENNLRGAQPAADHLRQLTRLLDARRQVYEEGVLRQQKLAEGQDLVTADAAILSAAAAPQTPTSANPVLFLPPALVLGLIAGGCLAVWRDSQDSTLRDARSLPGALGLAAAGFMPRESRAWGPGRWRAGREVALRRAALQALFAATVPPGATRHGHKVVLVTSSVAGEDGVALAQELAGYAAVLLPRVLLVTFDKDHAAVPAAPATESCPSPVPGMHLARSDSGLAPDVLRLDASRDPMGLIVGEPFDEGLHKLRDGYDCIVIQAGPVLEGGEAGLLATEADRILLAVRWGHTPRITVENALAILGRSEGPRAKPGAVAAVLTRVDVRRHLAYRFGDAIEAMAKAYRVRRAA